MVANISRNTFDPTKHYDKLVWQEGVPLVDSDFNELQDIIRDKLEKVVLYAMGNGSPDSGFLIVGTGATNDFTVTAGTFFVNGRVIWLEANTTYKLQTDYISPQALTTPGSNRTDIVYLHVYEDFIDSTQDPSIKNPVLLVETCQRIKLRARVEVAEGGTLPVSTGTDWYVQLATLARLGTNATITAGMVTDNRVPTSAPITVIDAIVAEVIASRGSLATLGTRLNVFSNADGTLKTVSISHGGTNSVATLVNNRIMSSVGGAIVEAAAITATRALVSDTNGIPTHSAVTATELGYVSGVTSAIQTQITTNVTNIATNTTNIASNVTAIVALTTIVTGHTANIATLTTSVAAISLTTIGKGAALVGINDAGNYIDGTTVEAAIQEISSRLDLLRPVAQVSPDNTVRVYPGHYLKSDGSKNLIFAGGNSPAFPPVSSDSRIDLLTLGDSLTLAIVAGSQSPSPVPPVYPTSGKVLAEVTINQTSGVTLDASKIKDVRAFGGGSGSGTILQQTSFVCGTPSGTYTGSLTTFDFSFPYSQDGKSLEVFYDGVRMVVTNDFTETGPSQITFVSPRVSGRSIMVRTVQGQSPIQSIARYREDYVVGTPSGTYTGSLTVFNTVNSYTPGGNNLKIFLDGVLLSVAAGDYVETAGRVATLSVGRAVAGQTITFDYAMSASQYNAQTVSGIAAQPSTSPAPSQLVALDPSGLFPLGVIPPIVNTNILINGSFEFWQRGISFTNPVSLSYQADRWKCESAGTLPTYLIAQEPTVIDGNGRYALKLNVTGNGANSGFYIYQLVENFWDYAGKTVTFQMRVQGSVTGAKIYIFDGVTITYSTAALSVTGSYQTLTVTATLSAALSGITIGFMPAGVVSTQVPIGTWYLDNAMAVIGPQSVPFIPRPYAQELALCQRYYEKTYPVATPPGTNTGTNVGLFMATQTGTTTTKTAIPFKVEKRIAPTVTLYSSAGVVGAQAWRTPAGVDTIRATAITDISTSQMSYQNTVALEYYGYGHWTLDAEI